MIVRGLAGSVLVLLGGWIVSTLPASTPMLRYGLLVDLRGSEAGRMAGLTLVLVGLGLLAHAWLTMCRVVSSSSDQRESLGLVRFGSFVWTAPLIVAPPLFSRDGWSYAAQGVMAANGTSPYVHGPWVLSGLPAHEAVDPRWWYTATPYGPLPIEWGKWMAEHTGNPLMLAIGHRMLALVGLALLAWAVPKLARWTGAQPALATLVVIASPFMLANGVGGLHNDLLMVGLMAAALVAAARRGWIVGAVLAGLAVSVKLPGAWACIGVVLITLPAGAPMLRRLRRGAEVGIVAFGVLLGLGWFSGLGNGWVDALGVPGTVNTPLSVTTLFGGALDRAGSLLGLGTDPAYFLGIVRQLGTLASGLVAAGVALRWPTGSPRRAVEAVALTVGVLVLLSPVVHLWYLLWPLPFLAALPLRRAPLLVVLAVSIIAGLVAPLDPSLHGAYEIIVWACVIIALLLSGLLLTRPARTRLERIVERTHFPVLDAPVPTGSLLDVYRKPAEISPLRLL